jgi:hypothetical protein
MKTLRAQITLEFLFVAAVYLSFLIVILNAHNSIKEKTLQTLYRIKYTNAAESIAILWSTLLLHNDAISYNDTEKWLGEAEFCYIINNEVTCGPAREMIYPNKKDMIGKTEEIV